jgi:hypothetical protein
VQPASAAASATPTDAAPNPYGPGGPMNVDRRYFRGGVMPQPMGTPPDQQPPVVGRGGSQTVLKEQLLHITLEVDIVKLLPKS